MVDAASRDYGVKRWHLAGMSAEYYKRLERGNAKGVSDAVIDGVSRALQLDAAEHAHLCDLVRAANAGTPPARETDTRLSLSPGMRQTIDAMSTVPVFIQNGRLDAVATNRLGRALFSVMFEDPRAPVNAARFVFSTRGRGFLPGLGQHPADMAILRAEAGRSPYDRHLSDLVGELSTRSDLFRRLWGSHDVREHRTGIKSIHHPIVGDRPHVLQRHGSLRPWPPDAGLLGRTRLRFPRRPATTRELG